MDNKSQKERLEQELRFLKESFEAEVISREEFEKGKDRIDKKLGEIKDVKKHDERQEDKIEDQIKPKGDLEDKKKTEVAEDEYFEPQKKDDTKKIMQEQKKDGKLFKYAVVFIVLLLLVFFSYMLFLNKKNTQQSTPSKTVYMCSSDSDCKEREQGICIEPKTKNARCEYAQIQKINVIVLNDKNCFNCGTQRVIGILESWFGALNIREIDYGTQEGKKIADQFDAKLLPAYILDQNLTENQNFEKFRQAFVKINDTYILSSDAAGSTFYAQKEIIPNKLDLFVITGDENSINAENNLKEFLANFNNVKFEKHTKDDSITKELGIKAFPSFLINGKVRFSGVLAADTIKENFCKMNKAPECSKSLSKSLV